MNDYDNLRAAVASLEEKGLVPEKVDSAVEDGSESDENVEKMGFATILKEKAKEMLAVKTEEFAEKLVAAVKDRINSTEESLSASFMFIISMLVGETVALLSTTSTGGILAGALAGGAIGLEIHHQIATLIKNKQNGAAVEAE